MPSQNFGSLTIRNQSHFHANVEHENSVIDNTNYPWPWQTGENNTHKMQLHVDPAPSAWLDKKWQYHAVSCFDTDIRTSARTHTHTHTHEYCYTSQFEGMALYKVGPSRAKVLAESAVNSCSLSKPPLPYYLAAQHYYTQPYHTYTFLFRYMSITMAWNYTTCTCAVVSRKGPTGGMHYLGLKLSFFWGGGGGGGGGQQSSYQYCICTGW